MHLWTKRESPEKVWGAVNRTEFGVLSDYCWVDGIFQPHNPYEKPKCKALDTKLFVFLIDKHFYLTSERNFTFPNQRRPRLSQKYACEILVSKALGSRTVPSTK
jgi:hypothetical protein